LGVSPGTFVSMYLSARVFGEDALLSRSSSA
jgi:hypothetical protein